MNKCFKWNLGNSRDIYVGIDPWIRGKDDFMLDTSSDIDNTIEVEQLFSQKSGDWDREKVRNMFNKRDAEAILSMRIPHHNTADIMAWIHSKDGHYSVKSGYRLWQEGNRQQLANENSTGWKRIWKLQILPKVKFFLWCFCRNNVPVCAILQRPSNMYNMKYRHQSPFTCVF